MSAKKKTKKNADHDDPKIKIEVTMIVRVGDLVNNSQNDLFFDLGRELKTFKFKGSIKNVELKKKISEHFSIPTGIMTLWICAPDFNNKFRPRSVWAFDDPQTLGNILTTHFEVNAGIPKLFVEVMRGPTGGFLRPPLKTQNNIMLFFKFLNYLGEIWFLGEYYVPNMHTLGMFTPHLLAADSVTDGVHLEFQKEGGNFISEDVPLGETDLVDGDTILTTAEVILFHRN